jgi:hypothetical protein
MKPHLAFTVLWLIAHSSWGQGTVLFANYVGGIIAQVTQFSGRPVDGRVVAQLLAAPPGLPLLPVGDPVPFLDGPFAGFIEPVERIIPDVPIGTAAQVQMVVWYGSLGDSFAEALARGVGGIGASPVLLVDRTGGGAEPPAPLDGLVGFGLGITLGWDPRHYPIIGSGFPLDAHGIRQSFDFYPTIEWVADVAVSGSIAYVASGYGGLGLFNLDDPAGPRRLGYVFLDHHYARSVAVAGRHAYVALSDWSGRDLRKGLRVVDVTDPGHPRAVSRVDLDGEPRKVSLSPDGRWAMVSAGSGGLIVVDIQDPASLKIAGRYRSGGEAQDFAAVGETGYLACGTAGLHVLRLTDPAQPTRLGVYSAGDDVVGVVVRGSLAYVSGRQSGLHVVDVSDPAQPRRVGLAAMMGGAGPLILSDRHVYVQNNPTQPNAAGSLSVVDITEPENPRSVARTSVAKDAMNFALSGGRLWVADTVALTGLPLGPMLNVTRGPAFEMTGLLAQPYEIQETTSLVAPWVWSRVMDTEGTGSPQALNLPTSASAARLIRAVAVP